MIDTLLDIVKHWESQIGQGLFLLILLGCGMECLVQLVRLGVILVRGWPTENDEEETKENHETNQPE